MIKRFVERRGRNAAHMTVTPVDTVQYCSRRSPSPEISFGTRVYIENKDEDVEKNNEGIMDPAQPQLESPSASTGFETHGPQCHPNWETGRTTAAGCLCGLEFGSKHFFPLRMRYWNFNTGSFPADKTQTKRQDIQRSKQAIRPRWERMRATALRSGCTGSLFFPGGDLGMGAVASALCFLYLSVCFVMYCSYQVIIFPRAEKIWGEKRKSIKSVTGGQASSCPSTPRRSPYPG